jgi:hypothetical protein
MNSDLLKLYKQQQKTKTSKMFFISKSITALFKNFSLKNTYFCCSSISIAFLRSI